MTKKDFFRIMIKLFGLYLGISTLYQLMPNIVNSVIYGFDWYYFGWLGGIVVLISAVLLLLFNKTDKLVAFFKLAKGFDDEQIRISTVHSKTIAQLAVLLMGFYLILDYAPYFLVNSFYAFKEKVASTGLSDTLTLSDFVNLDYFNWGLSGVYVVVGYLLITNYHRIASWLFLKDEKTNAE